MQICWKHTKESKDRCRKYLRNRMRENVFFWNAKERIFCPQKLSVSSSIGFFHYTWKHFVLWSTSLENFYTAFSHLVTQKLLFKLVNQKPLFHFLLMRTIFFRSTHAMLVNWLWDYLLCDRISSHVHISSDKHAHKLVWMMMCF